MTTHFMAEFDKILPISEVKRDLLSLAKRIQDTGETIAITKGGKPTAVLLSLDEYESLLETLEVLGDAKLMKALARARREVEDGKTVSHAEVWGVD